MILNGISLLVGLGFVMYLAAFLLFDQLTLNVYNIYMVRTFMPVYC